MLVEISQYQVNAATKLRNGYILKGGVGSGKSRTALYHYFVDILGGRPKVEWSDDEYIQPKRQTPLYIITTAKKRDSREWEAEAILFGLTPGGEIPMVVDSWNNIQKYVGVHGAFFIFDEQRLVGSGEWVRSFQKIAKENLWILLTATPGDTWMDYCPVFVANGFYKNRTDFVHQHVAMNYFGRYPTIDHYFDTVRLEKARRKITVEMKHKPPAAHVEKRVECAYDEELMRKVWKDRWNIYDDVPIEDISEMFRVSRKLVNSDPSRFEEIIEILGQHKRLIIFYNFDYELEILKGLSAHTYVAQWNGHKHDPLPTLSEWVYLVQYSAGSEGWNCVTTDAVLFYSLSYSYRATKQGMGRIDRMNTAYRTLYYYFLVSNSPPDKRIWQALSEKKDFSERAYAYEFDCS